MTRVVNKTKSYCILLNIFLNSLLLDLEVGKHTSLIVTGSPKVPMTIVNFQDLQYYGTVGIYGCLMKEHIKVLFLLLLLLQNFQEQQVLFK